MTTDKTEAAHRNTVEQLVGNPTVQDIVDIAAEVKNAKELLFSQFGWEMNHQLTEGDVRLVLESVRKIANDQDKRAAFRS